MWNNNIFQKYMSFGKMMVIFGVSVVMSQAHAQEPVQQNAPASRNSAANYERAFAELPPAMQQKAVEIIKTQTDLKKRIKGMSELNGRLQEFVVPFAILATDDSQTDLIKIYKLLKKLGDVQVEGARSVAAIDDFFAKNMIGILENAKQDEKGFGRWVELLSEAKTWADVSENDIKPECSDLNDRLSDMCEYIKKMVPTHPDSRINQLARKMQDGWIDKQIQLPAGKKYEAVVLDPFSDKADLEKFKKLHPEDQYNIIRKRYDILNNRTLFIAPDRFHILRSLKKRLDKIHDVLNENSVGLEYLSEIKTLGKSFNKSFEALDRMRSDGGSNDWYTASITKMLEYKKNKANGASFINILNQRNAENDELERKVHRSEELSYPGRIRINEILKELSPALMAAHRKFSSNAPEGVAIGYLLYWSKNGIDCFDFKQAVETQKRLQNNNTPSREARSE